MNSRNFGNEPLPPSLEEGGNGDDDGGAVVGNSNFHLTRQSSIYSLTFDELQNTMGGIGKDFGSMNMDELLKNLWNAEETQQTMGYSGGGGGGAQLGGAVPGGHLQRQGSLTLPRTLSQKTVDEVWKNISKEDGGGKDGSNDLNVNFPQTPRQQTLGGMTLEEFLFRAGVVREDTQFAAKPINNMSPLGVGFPQIDRSSGLMGNRISESNNQITMQSLNSPFNLNGSRSSQQQQLLPQQTTATFASSMALPTSDQLGSPGIKRGLAGLSDPVMNSNLQGGGIGMVGLGAGAVTVVAGSPANQLSSDGIGKSNGDASPFPVAPYAYNGGLRGRKRCCTVDKVVERRQRRMIKNRESAARSRARKQAYTVELEAEVAKLKEENEDLRKRTAELMEMQKNQVVEIMNMHQGGKRQCLRRTQSGQW